MGGVNNGRAWCSEAKHTLTYIHAYEKYPHFTKTIMCKMAPNVSNVEATKVL
jgi:hypothetical protein